MEPVITASLISAGVKLFRIFIESWNTSKPNDKKQARVENWMKKNYGSLHDTISKDSTKILASIETGKQLTLKNLTRILYPRRKFDDKTLKLLKYELRYRLEYLAFIGVIRSLHKIRQYEITRLGITFLATARSKKHYP